MTGPMLVLAMLAQPSADSFWYGKSADGTATISLHFFYSKTCPHCQAAEPFVSELPSRFPWLRLERHPVSESREIARLYVETARVAGREAIAVPGFAFCRKLVIGYDGPDTTGDELLRALESCRDETAAPMNSVVHLPLLGDFDTSATSLPVLTVVLASVDAFNPCAFFVLLFLLSLLVHARSRGRMLIIGGCFVFISGLAYFVFMAAWLNLFLMAGELRVMTVMAGLLALGVASLNIKDFFAFRGGPTLSIPESAKPGLFRRMRQIVGSGRLPAMLAGTVVLAVVANSYELLCTAGFPMVYTRALTLAKLGPWASYGWLAAYNVIYVLPLLAIVLLFVRTMGSRKLSEREGRALKLMSGLMMLGFGGVLLFEPERMTDGRASILILVSSILLTLAAARFGRDAKARSAE